MTMLTAHVSELCNTLAEQPRSHKHKIIINCTVSVRLKAQKILKNFPSVLIAHFHPVMWPFNEACLYVHVRMLG